MPYGCPGTLYSASWSINALLTANLKNWLIWFARVRTCVPHLPPENCEHSYRVQRRAPAVGKLCGRRGRNACRWPVQFTRQVQRNNSDRIIHTCDFLVRPAPDFFIYGVLCNAFHRPPLSIITITNRDFITDKLRSG